MTSGSVESIPGSGRRPAFAVERVIGANHRRTDKPCQDEAGVAAIADTVAIAVADGHSKSRHADVGARLAVQVALCALVRFAEDLGERASNPHEVRGYAEHPLRVQIVREWAERVRAKAGDETPLIEYGSTILVALATPDFLLVGQLGDGDVLLVSEDRSVDVPLPADPAAFADETPSLCLPEASHSFRMRVLPAPSEEALLLLSTDGYGKSYATDAEFRQIGPDYLDLVRAEGVSGLTPCLKGFLEQVTTQGSGDDIALALLHWPPPASRTAPKSPGVSADGTPSITDIEKPDPPVKEEDGRAVSQFENAAASLKREHRARYRHLQREGATPQGARNDSPRTSGAPAPPRASEHSESENHRQRGTDRAMSTEETRARFRLSQETIAIIAVGIALAGLQLATVGDLRDEARADRAAAQADRAAWQAESRQLRDEARIDREHFQREILRLTAEHAKVAARVESAQRTPDIPDRVAPRRGPSEVPRGLRRPRAAARSRTLNRPGETEMSQDPDLKGENSPNDGDVADAKAGAAKDRRRNAPYR